MLENHSELISTHNTDLETHAHETKVEGHDIRLDSRFSSDDDCHSDIHSLYDVVAPSHVSGINNGETLEEVEWVSDYNRKNRIKERT